MAMRVGPYSLAHGRYEELCTLPLTVAQYQKPSAPGCAATSPQSSWTARNFDSGRHMRGELQAWTPDILVTHWHDETYHWKHLTNAMTDLAARFRAERGGRYRGTGPFLVAVFGEPGDPDRRFEGTEGEERVGRLISDGYDMVMHAGSVVLPGGAPWNIAIGMWKILRASLEEPVEDVPFDFVFYARLADVSASAEKIVDIEASLAAAVRRHEERIRWWEEHRTAG